MKRTKNVNTYKDVIRLVDHYKAIGITEYQLDQCDDLPWEKVVSFKYIHSECFEFYTAPINGIEFYWEVYLGCFEGKVKNKQYEILMDRLKSTKIKKEIVSKLNFDINKDIKNIKQTIKNDTNMLNYCLEQKAIYNKK